MIIIIISIRKWFTPVDHPGCNTHSVNLSNNLCERDDWLADLKRNALLLRMIMIPITITATSLMLWEKP